MKFSIIELPTGKTTIADTDVERNKFGGELHEEVANGIGIIAGGQFRAVAPKGIEHGGEIFAINPLFSEKLYCTILVWCDPIVRDGLIRSLAEGSMPYRICLPNTGALVIYHNPKMIAAECRPFYWISAIAAAWLDISADRCKKGQAIPMAMSAN